MQESRGWAARQGRGRGRGRCCYWEKEKGHRTGRNRCPLLLCDRRTGSQEPAGIVAWIYCVLWLRFDVGDDDDDDGGGRDGDGDELGKVRKPFQPVRGPRGPSQDKGSPRQVVIGKWLHRFCFLKFSFHFRKVQ